MDNKLYKLMNWPRIEAVIYSEENAPYDILGPHMMGKSVLFQMFYPEAARVSVVIDSELVKMEMVDEAGFYACLIPGRIPDNYQYKIERKDGKVVYQLDAYHYPVKIASKDIDKFCAGIHYTIYEKLGAHPYTADGVQGTVFAVWAPNAQRVSVVGDFNQWDGRIHQMQMQEGGIFALFIPELGEGDCYQYEIKTKAGMTFLKADPYAYGSQLRPGTASVICDLEYSWNDETWIDERKKQKQEEKPVSIYELYLGTFKKSDSDDYLNYKELAEAIISYVKQMGYTHVEFMPVMEHFLDASWGYQITGYYAPTSRYGTARDLMYLIDRLHQEKIGVIFDWAPSQFPRDAHGLSGFDGTCLYEHLDPRQGTHPRWGTMIYNYGRPQVSNFLIANALYWVEKFHIDGIRMNTVAAMLYLDYGKNDGEWIANIYGGNENLEAIELLKHLNSIMKLRNPGVLMIAEEASAFPGITGDLNEGGLGFDLKWNEGCINDFLSYLSYDPYFRAHHHNELTLSMIYAYSEKFILSLSHTEVTHGRSSLLGRMPGNEEDKFSNLRAGLAYLMTHPGKKLLFMGQDLGDYNEFDETIPVNWSLLHQEQNQGLNRLVQKLNLLYSEYPALYRLDNKAEGFEWINDITPEKCMVTFLRKTDKVEDTLVIAANFANISQDLLIGVPYCGKYKEILNTDDTSFGGQGRVNTRVKNTAEEERDGRRYSFKMTAAPLSVSIFKYTPYTLKEEQQIQRRKAAQEAREKAREAEREAAIAKKEADKAREEAEKANRQAEEAIARAVEAERIALEKMEKC